MLVGEKGRELRGLQTAFHRVAMERPYATMFLAGQRACWLAIHDPLKRPCAGHWEAFHFVGRQEIRNHPPFFGLDPEIIMLIEWDPRLGGPGCVEHHRRYDKHADAGPGSALVVPEWALPADVEECVEERGLQSIAERRFSAS